jgi:hypothetical protein
VLTEATDAVFRRPGRQAALQTDVSVGKQSRSWAVLEDRLHTRSPIKNIFDPEATAGPEVFSGYDSAKISIDP